MINRTYLVLMPSNAATMGFIDILPRGPVGTPALPVRIAAGGTAPPAGWQVFAGPVNGDGQFAEWRGRPITFDNLAAAGAAAGFNPRVALGWRFSVTLADSGLAGVAMPSVQFSASLVGTIAAPFAAAQIADPAYGPSIRLVNAAAVQGRIFLVTFGVAQAQDEDRSDTGL